jgi:hypothetical protein
VPAGSVPRPSSNGAIALDPADANSVLPAALFVKYSIE